MDINLIRDLYIDPSDFDSEVLDSWETLWDDSLTLYENYYQIIRRFVILPYEDDILPIVTAHFCSSAKWAKCLPILLCWGLQGSGKSTIANLAIKLRGMPGAFSPNDTFASIRNYLNFFKYWDEEQLLKRDNTVMAWDNIYTASLQENPSILKLLVVGYKSDTSKMKIADSSGGHISFDVFCPKILSSIEPIHSIDSFGELRRRMMIIPHQVVKSINADESTRNISDLINLDSVDWKGIDEKFIMFWMDRQNQLDYVATRASLSRKVGKTIKLPESMDSLKWEISHDLCTTLCVANNTPDIEWAIEKIVRYWERINVVVDSSQVLKSHLELFIDMNCAPLIKQNEIAKKAGFQPTNIILPPSSLKKYMDTKFASGEIPDAPTTKKISPLMAELGWRLTKDGWIKSFD